MGLPKNGLPKYLQFSSIDTHVHYDQYALLKSLLMVQVLLNPHFGWLNSICCTTQRVVTRWFRISPHLADEKRRFHRQQLYRSQQQLQRSRRQCQKQFGGPWKRTGGGVVPEYSENKIQMGFLTREACDLMRFRSWENDIIIASPGSSRHLSFSTRGSFSSAAAAAVTYHAFQLLMIYRSSLRACDHRLTCLEATGGLNYVGYQ